MLKEVIIGSIEHSDVDMQSPYYEDGERNQIIFQKGIDFETEAMSIDDALATLHSLKEGGATHMYATVNCDHHSYTFTGVCYNFASEEDMVPHTCTFYVAPYSVYGYQPGSLWKQHTSEQYRSTDGKYYLPKEIVEGWEKIIK